MIKKLKIFMALSLLTMNACWAREGTCEIITPPPKSTDCKERDPCLMKDGRTWGFCRQVYNSLDSKCFVCEHGTGPKID